MSKFLLSAGLLAGFASAQITIVPTTVVAPGCMTPFVTHTVNVSTSVVPNRIVFLLNAQLQVTQHACSMVDLQWVLVGTQAAAPVQLAPGCLLGVDPLLVVGSGLFVAALDYPSAASGLTVHFQPIGYYQLYACGALDGEQGTPFLIPGVATPFNLGDHRTVVLP